MSQRQCEFTRLAERHFECKACGRNLRTKRDRPPIAACRCLDVQSEILDEFRADVASLGVTRDTTVSLVRLFWHWHQAITRWKAAGKPIRTQAEMDAILVVCGECKHYEMRLGVFGYCKLCGCNVSGIPIGELNKIRMKTEVCPDGQWT